MTSKVKSASPDLLCNGGGKEKLVSQEKVSEQGRDAVASVSTNSSNDITLPDPSSEVVSHSQPNQYCIPFAIFVLS